MAAEEQLVLDGLTLNDATFRLVELSAPPPRQRQEWIGAADSEWQALVRVPLHENREIIARLQVAPQASTDLAMDKVGQVIDKLRLASRTDTGIGLVWTPAEGTRSVTFDVLAGEITDLPIDWQSGWFAKAPSIMLRLVTKPYWRGTETLTTTASSSTPFVTKEITGVTGDIPALGRLIVTDTATQSRRHVEWGIEGQFYNAATSLLIASDDMVTSGFSGTQTTTTGAYDPNATGNNSITVGLSTSATAVAGTGNLSHIGTFRVKGRVQAATTDVEVRLAWQAADGPWTANEWVPLTIGGSAWEEKDLGSIIVPAVIAGTQRWTGRVEARTTTGTDTLKLNYLTLVPAAEGYGRARAVGVADAGVMTAYDEFTGHAGAALNARVAPTGGSWATSGAATDFFGAFIDENGATAENMARSESSSSPRYGVLGSAKTDTQVKVRFGTKTPVTAATATGECGVLARWVDSSNHLKLVATVIYATGSGAGYYWQVRIAKVVAGATTTIAGIAIFPAAPLAAVMELVVYSSGTARGRLYTTQGALLYELVASDSVLATGGTLDDGSAGIIDAGSGSLVNARYYDDFSIATPTAEPIALYSGRNMQFRHDDTIRQDSTGTYTGRPPSYRGSRFLVPVGTSRVLVKARRNDIEGAADANVTDATQIQIGWTPRGIAVPR